LLVPFWTSFIVRTYAWIVILGSNGVVNGAAQSLGLTRAPWSLLYGRGAVLLGLIHAMLPFAIVPIYAAVERIDDAILESASTLGARPWAVFREIIVPISLPGILAAALLVFIDSMGAFITSQLLGGPQDMMIAQLVQERFLGSFDWPSAPPSPSSISASPASPSRSSRSRETRCASPCNEGVPI
jgi:spermidine/putrescine transport system permease protein